MNWNHRFQYNEHIVNLYVDKLRLMCAINTLDAGVTALTETHIRCINWLDDNLVRGKDYDFSAHTEPTLVSVKYIYFDKEEDMLAFRLACGV